MGNFIKGLEEGTEGLGRLIFWAPYLIVISGVLYIVAKYEGRETVYNVAPPSLQSAYAAAPPAAQAQIPQYSEPPSSAPPPPSSRGLFDFF